MPYTGITPEALFLLSQNRFEDSKEFYDAHKAQLKSQAFTPLSQIMEALADDFSCLDPSMLLNPSKMMSRVRRDTRFTKEKHMYRDEAWLMFMRPKSEHPFLWPCMWFEIKPGEGFWSAGVCGYEQTPKLMQFLRNCIAEQPEEFLAAAQSAIAGGAVMEAESYKKDRAPDAPEHLKAYLNAKSFVFIHRSYDLALLEGEALIDRLRAFYIACHPMYRWLMNAAEEFIAEGIS